MFLHISKTFVQTNSEVILMSKNIKKNTKDKLASGPSTTGSYGTSTDANLTTASSGAGDSHGLFMNYNTDKKQD
jgi:hypothetical protein